MKQTNKICVCLLCLAEILMVIVCLFSCAKQKNAETAESVAYDSDQVLQCVRLEAYTGLEIVLSDENSSKSDAVWNDVLRRAEILAYPEEQVAYYVSQSCLQYRYLAQRDGVDYEDMLDYLGVTEESILAEAKQMVKGDLVYRYIVLDAGIALTDEEKETLFARYAEQYVKQYGYTEEYVTEHMADLVYDSMLFDKTVSYLTTHNTFVTETSVSEY